MGFMTMPLTNPVIYSWIADRGFSEVKNLSMRVKKWISAIRPVKPTEWQRLSQRTVVEGDYSTKSAKARNVKGREPNVASIHALS